MANFPPNSGRSPNNGGKPRSLRDSMNLANGSGPHRLPPEEDDDTWGDLPEEALEQTSLEEKQHILNSLKDEGTGSEELEQLQGENDQLRNLIVELRDQLEQATSQSQELWEEREREFEIMLEEKSEKIRELYMRLKELEEGGGGAKPAEAAGGGDSDLPDDQELVALNDELERERCALEQEHRTLEEDRRRFREDEEDMMTQMREMELQMSKERAELARQRNELQRLHSEIRHELEVAQRDAGVNERLRMLQRRTQDAAGSGEHPARAGKGSSGEVPAAPKKKSSQTDAAPKKKSSQTGAAAPKKKQSDSGFFGRLFNRDK